MPRSCFGSLPASSRPEAFRAAFSLIPEFLRNVVISALPVAAATGCCSDNRGTYHTELRDAFVVDGGVPTIGESGLPNYEVTSWNGLAAPAGVAPEIVTLLSRAVNEALRSPDIQAISRRAGMEARGSTSEELRARIKSDIAKWADVIEKAAIEKK